MTEGRATLLRWPDRTAQPLLPGVTATGHLGRQLSATLFQLDPHAQVPRHSHPNEEFGQILAGSLDLRTGGESSTLGPGEGFLIPGDLPHEAQAGPEGCTLLECYAPPRDPRPSSAKERA